MSAGQFPDFAPFSEKNYVFFFPFRQSYGCGKKSAFFGKYRTFQRKLKGEKLL